MKPKTALQRKVVEISSQLPKISKKQSDWAYKKCFNTYAARLRNNVYCLECGNSWKDNAPDWHNEIVKPICPNCQSELEMFNHNGNVRKTDYFTVLTTKGDFQVQRVMIAHKDMKKKTEAKYHFAEVCQHWIGLDGKKTTISLACQGSSMYYDNWNYDSGLEVRSNSYNNNLRDSINITAIYPKRKILPIIKRNGFKGQFHDMAPQKLFAQILSDNYAEVLLKSNQINALQYYINSRRSEVTDNWNSIKICTKNGYIIKDFSTWKDYTSLLKYFGKDTNSTKYICPTDLKASHDKLVEKKKKVQLAMKIEEMKKTIKDAQKKYKKNKKAFFGLQFSDGEIVVKVLNSVEEFLVEGDELKHCVFTNEYFNKKQSLVLSASIGNTRIETIEISLKNFSIIQSRGKDNVATKHNSKIIDLVTKNLPKIEKIALKKAM